MKNKLIKTFLITSSLRAHDKGDDGTLVIGFLIIIIFLYLFFSAGE
tara:strand:- start:726 stop:863 length:138 start_codon:yes stop_codon:yes gene_type:complete